MISQAWPRRPGYLDTATYGLPPRATVERSHRVIDEWATGTGSWRAWNDAADEARRCFASLIGVPATSVAVGPAASTLIGIVAASVPAGSDVVVPADDFRSLVYPLLVQAERGVSVREVPLEALAESVTEQTAVVAWSAVQSRDGRIADIDAVLEAAARAGAMTVVDSTQATGWLPLPAERFDAMVCGAYKWLCCPRGTAFLVASARVLATTTPHAASWYAADDPHGGYYGGPLRLADDARRFDVPPAWFAWEGAVTSLETLADVGVDAIHAHDVALADRVRAAFDLEPTGSAIVAIEGDAGLEMSLAEVGITAATRANGCRLSFHLYNDESDVEAAVAALRRARIGG